MANKAMVSKGLQEEFAVRPLSWRTGSEILDLDLSDSASITDHVIERLKRLVGEGKGEMTLGSTLPIRNLPYLHPDLTLEAALRHVYQVPLVPVVHRADFRRLEGVISREDVLEKYKLMEED